MDLKVTLEYSVYSAKRRPVLERTIACTQNANKLLGIVIHLMLNPHRREAHRPKTHRWQTSRTEPEDAKSTKGAQGPQNTGFQKNNSDGQSTPEAAGYEEPSQSTKEGW